MSDAAVDRITRVVADWVTEARDKLAGRQLAAADLDRLLSAVQRAGQGKLRQRVLYLHASGPSIRSPLVGSALHDPVPGSVTQIDPLAPDLPYASVHDAILDGWRVIHFPQQLAPYDDREIDLIGYEFVLEKLEVYDD
jgi:hypothetical protein